MLVDPSSGLVKDLPHLIRSSGRNVIDKVEEGPSFLSGGVNHRGGYKHLRKGRRDFLHRCDQAGMSLLGVVVGRLQVTREEFLKSACRGIRDE